MYFVSFRWSNINSPGKWVFRVSDTGETGNVILPDTYTGNYQEKNTYFGNTCSDGGSICHSAATCVDYVEGFCCKCEAGQYGNGINCIKNGKSFIIILTNWRPLSLCELTLYLILSELTHLCSKASNYVFH